MIHSIYYIFIVLTHTKLALAKIEISSRCDMTKCGNENKISFEYEDSNPIAVQNTEALLYLWPEEEEIIYTLRRRFIAYCYQGSILDPNTGCDTYYEEKPISKSDARNYVQNDWCETGCECNARYCTGSDSDCCLDDRLTNKNGPSVITNTHYETAGLGRHSCTSRWECRTKLLVLSPTLSISNGVTKRTILVADRHRLNLDDKYYSQGANFSDSVRYYSTSNKAPMSHARPVKARCYSSDKDKIDCLVKQNGKELPFQIDPVQMKGVLRNMILIIIGSLKTIENGKIITIDSRSNSIHETPILTKIEEGDRAASISSLNEVINGVRITQMQEIYNTVQNNNKIKELGNAVNKLIIFLSQKFPYLLSHITGGSYKTNWINDKIYQTCPCLEPPEIPIYSNCNKGSIFKDGEILKTDNKNNECISIDERNIKNVSLLKRNLNLDVEIIDYLPPQAAANDASNWDWLVQERNKITDYKNELDYDGIKSIFDSLFPKFSFKDLMLYFCTIICVLVALEKCLFLQKR